MAGGYGDGITPRGGKLLLRVHLKGQRDPISGRKRYASRTIPRVGKREAQEALEAFRAELRHGDHDGRRAAFRTLLDEWYAAKAHEWSPNTAYVTRRAIEGRLRPLHDLRVEQVTTARLDGFYAALRERGKDGHPLAASTVVRLHGIIRLALDQAVRWEWIRSNPADRASPGKPDPAEITPPSPDDVQKLLAAAEATDPDLLLFLVLDAETGARRAELGALRFSDFGDGTVTIARALAIGPAGQENERRYAGHYWPAVVQRGAERTALIEKPRPKTRGSRRTIALTSTSAELVADQRRRLDVLAFSGGGRYPADGFVFPATPDGDRPIRSDTWTHRFARLRAGVGLDGVRLHDVRHFVATSLLAAGVDVSTVAGRLGHGGGGKTTLAIYGHFLERPDRVAAEVMGALLRGAGDVDDGGGAAPVVPIRGAR